MKYLEFRELERKYYRNKVITLWAVFCVGFAIGAGIATAIINSLPRGERNDIIRDKGAVFCC